MRKFTQKQFKKNTEDVLKKTKEELIKVIFEEREIERKKEELMNDINYWEGCLK